MTVAGAAALEGRLRIPQVPPDTVHESTLTLVHKGKISLMMASSPVKKKIQKKKNPFSNVLKS